MPRFKCDVCQIVFCGSSDRVARSLRDRHKREHHGPANIKTKAVQARRRQDAAAQRARRAATDAHLALLGKVLVFVMCPSRRERTEHMFSQTRSDFVAHGFPVQSVRRMEGWDLQSPQHQHRSSSGFLLEFFITKFLPNIIDLFSSEPRLKTVFWAEDWNYYYNYHCNYYNYYNYHNYHNYCLLACPFETI